MSTVSAVRLSLVWVRLVEEALVDPFGELTSGPGYRNAFSAARVADANLTRPWEDEGSSWSRFWSSYLGSPRQLRHPDPAVAWDHLIPLCNKVVEHAGPGDSSVELQSLLYPHAVAVIATVDIEHSWAVEDLAKAVAELRSADTWGSSRGRNRSLNGLAGDLADASACLLSPGAAPAGVSDPCSIVAPTVATGEASAFELNQPAVPACLAGLASIGPNGVADDDNYLGPNSDTNLKATIYATSRGHVIWRPDAMLADPPGGAVTCLHRNQTSAIAHARALGRLAEWAAERNSVAAEIRPLLARALFNLIRLKSGNRGNTYRSGIVMKRVAAYSEVVDEVRSETGLGFGL